MLAMTLELGVWAIICMVFTLILIAKSGSILGSVVAGFILYLFGLLVGLVFEGAWMLLILPFKLVYTYPIPSAILLCFVAVIYAVYRLTSHNKKKAANHKDDAREARIVKKIDKTRVIDVEFEKKEK